MRRPLLIAAFIGLVFGAGGNSAIQSTAADWKVQAGKNFQRAGEYTVRLTNTDFQDAINAYGQPTSCRVVGKANHAVASWTDRGIWIDLWTFGGLPEGETGCLSPDLIHISEIRLTGPRWTTSFGLHVGDRTTKLRKLYPKAIYKDRTTGAPRSEYYLVSIHIPNCIGICRFGDDEPRLTAQVKNGRVIAFWLPVFAQGD